MSKPLEKAVIMARGLGTRMRKAEAEASALSDDQKSIAQTGVKAMIPIGRPFLDYVISALADSGIRRVCLVIGPEHEQLQSYYTVTSRPSRVSVEFAIQEKPLGTANAIAAARAFAADDEFLAMNSDNYYPVSSLLAARQLPGMGLVGFDELGLLKGSNIPAERVKGFAVIQSDSNGCLTQIIEKPSDEVLKTLPRPLWISMNLWRFAPPIFDACDAIPLSVRGEYEITDAVRWCMARLNCPFHVAQTSAPVLDLSYQSDIQPVAELLRGQEVSL